MVGRNSFYAGSMRGPNSKLSSPTSARSLAVTSPSSLGSASNSILSEFSDSVQESPGGIWGPDGRPLDQGSNQTVASDNSVASTGVNFEQSKFDLNGDEAYSDFYDEIRSKSGTRKAVRSLSLDSACPTHLDMIAPRQLADIFSIFHDDDDDRERQDKQQRKQLSSPLSSLYQPSEQQTATTLQTASTFSSSLHNPKKAMNEDSTIDGTDSDAATEVTSNTFSPNSVVCHPKIESLQRECETLKQIINTDSTKLLQLQGERKNLQEKLDRSDKEKMELEKKVRNLELEKEASLRRQKTQDDTIRHLKAKLANIPRDKTYAGASIRDIEELRLTNELLASQVVHAERKLEQAISESGSDKENVQPPVTPVQRQNKQDWGVSSASSKALGYARGVLEDISPQTLALQLQSLENRLQAMEEDNLFRTSKEEPSEHVDKATQSEEGEATQSEDSNIKTEEEDGNESLWVWSVILDGIGIEGIEVGLDGTVSVATVDVGERVSEPPVGPHPGPTQNKNASKCPGGAYFCDCFPSHIHANDEDE